MIPITLCPYGIPATNVIGIIFLLFPLHKGHAPEKFVVIVCLLLFCNIDFPIGGLKPRSYMECIVIKFLNYDNLKLDHDNF